MRIDRKIIDDLNTKTHPKEKNKFLPITVEGQTPFSTPDTTQKTPIEAPKTPEKTETQADTPTGTIGTPSDTKKNYTDYLYDASTDKAYTEALAALQAARANMPTYKNSYDADIEAIYNEIVGREDFRYDINEDALYHQYADQYQHLGELAMMDTVGQASAMTGGYGNSYAVTAGNQAFQQYLAQLNAVVPELYGMAYDRYTAEGEEMLNQYGMLRDRADDEYNKYLAELDQYWQNVSYLGGEADKAYDRGRENFYAAQELAAAEAEREAAREAAKLEYNSNYEKMLLEQYEKETEATEKEEENKKARYEKILSKITEFSSMEELQTYLAQQATLGFINLDDDIVNIAQAIWESENVNEDETTYSEVPLAERDFIVKHNGGNNLLGGIDRNGRVADQYGNEYTLAQLYRDLKDSMGSEAARNYVIALQERLGIDRKE